MEPCDGQMTDGRTPTGDSI